MLLDDDSGALTIVAGFGDEMPALAGLPPRPRHRRGRSPTTGVAEIVNDVDLDPPAVTEHTTIKALIAAPLRVGERVTGVIALGSTVPMAYTAAELKLLNTLALQAATAIENARLFERTVQAARERERLLALQQGDRGRAGQARERADARRPHPGEPVPADAAGAAPATTSPRATARPASAAATTTTRLSVTGDRRRRGCCCAWPTSRARACRRRW